MKNDNKLYFPANISLEKEWWKGFGTKEVKKLLIVLAPMLVLCAALTIFLKVHFIMVILIGAGIMAVAITGLQRMDNYMSIYNYVKLLKSFYSEQQIFYFKGGVK